jgi:1-acyl-sn-glycerol-3-phosphate acyltransferase
VSAAQGGDALRELRAAASSLRAEIERRFGPAAAGGAPLPGWLARTRDALLGRVRNLDVLRLYEELRERVSLLGIDESSGEVDDFGLDARTVARSRRWLDFLFERWWRIEVTGVELLPRAQPILLVANRSGLLPYDGLMVAHALVRARGEPWRPRFMVEDWLIGLPFSQPLLARLGGVRACAENVDRLLGSGRSAVVFPEGQKGAFKRFADRYHLQRFARGGFVALAARHRVPMVPVAVVGAEEVHPILFEWKLASRLLGVPVPVTPTLPALGLLGAVPLPTRWRIRFGPPIHPPSAEEDAEDPLRTNRLRERVRGAIQELLDVEVRRRRGIF